MRIRKINVEELFDYYSYEIVMKEHDAISIIHAPNGYGGSLTVEYQKNTLQAL